ncbi:hypothetical protein pdam_00021846, partial [Pocillopora damicornis]
ASTPPTDELWITYGSGKNVQNILAISLGPDKASTLPIFHAPIGCDTVSSFFRGLLKVLKASPQEITEEYMAFLERFVVLIYNLSLPLDRDLSNTSKEQCSKEATYGAKPSFISQCFQAHQPGGGDSSTTTGRHSGQRTHLMWMQSLM